MQTIVFNRAHSKIAPLNESFALRVAYVFSDKAIAAGWSPLLIMFDEFYSGFTKAADKLIIIEDFYTSNLSDGTAPPDIEQAKKDLKEFSKIKHPPPLHIISIKQLERKIDERYKYVVGKRQEHYSKSGLPQLAELYRSGGISLYEIGDKSAESTEYDLKPASKLLLLELGEKYSPPFMFCLPNEFYHPDFFNTLRIFNSDDRKARRVENIYLDYCFTLPNMNWLTPTELKSIHDQLGTVSAKFRNNADEWVGISEKEGTAKASNEFFKEEMVPAISALRQSVEANTILQACDRHYNGQLKTDIFIGEIPVETLWDFYKYIGVATEESLKIAMEAKDRNPSLSGRWPVMICRTAPQRAPWNKTKKEEQQVTASKKSLDID